jgi:muramidase (phage lysozyme)
LYSTASGRYQVLARFWSIYRAQLGLPEFGPASQDAVAVQQIKERGAITPIEAGDIEGAIAACANIWASLPGNSYGQGGRTMDALAMKYRELSQEESSRDV